MTDEKLPPPIWIDTSDELQRLVEELSVQDRIAVDTESNSLHAYRERVCLIQFSVQTTDFILDPLAISDISSLSPLFSNPKIEKIFHAAEYDLICLRRDFGFVFDNIFDTMQAARILGCPSVGLEKLLLERFDVKVDKRHQKANWAQRPLTPSLLDYARMDTHYLFDLRDLLAAELEQAGRMGFAMDDFKLVCQVEVPKEKDNGNSWKRYASRKDVSPRELTILSELTACRDKIAERLDRPAFKVIDDSTLLQIARDLPEKDVDLVNSGMSPRQIKMWGNKVLAAVREGVDAPLVKREQVKRPEEALLRRLEKLKVWRKKIAEEMKVESDIILPKKFLTSLAEKPPQSHSLLETVMRDSPYRYETFGTQIYELIGGHA